VTIQWTLGVVEFCVLTHPSGSGVQVPGTPQTAVWDINPTVCASPRARLLWAVPTESLDRVIGWRGASLPPGSQTLVAGGIAMGSLS
jgi:hypothetical protein